MENKSFWVTLVSSSTGMVHKAMDTKAIRESSYTKKGKAYMTINNKEYRFIRIEN